MGIDPGLHTTGYGIIEKNQNCLNLMEAGFIKTSPKDNIELRLLKIYEGLTLIVQKHKLDAIVLEKLYAHYKHPLTACLLGHARGTICLVCAQNNIKLFEYAATRTKKAVSGRGSASKLQIQQMVLNELGMKGKNEIPLDITDALSLAIAHSHILRSTDLSAFTPASRQARKTIALTLAECESKKILRRISPKLASEIKNNRGYARRAQFKFS